MLCILCIPMISSQAMLKLTHSFCRYTKLTCENININTTHVKTYFHLSYGRKTCVTLYTQYSIVDSFAYTCQQVRQFASIRRRLRVKRAQNSSSAAMNNQLLPSVAYVSHGGDFQVEDDNLDWDGPSTSSNNPSNKRRDKIPFNFRQWERVAAEAAGQPFRFKVVSYNMLAQYLLECHPYLYTGCDPEDLSWKVRSERLFREIMDVDPDIICLQEVQSTHIRSFYVRFEQIGYYGIFKQKTGHRQDGCAIYFKREVFNMDDHLSVEYYQPNLAILNRDNVGLMMKLVPREYPTATVVVATTHLLYNPRRTDVRLAQIQVLLAELDRFAYYEDEDGKNCGYYPIVLAGDLNSLPESSVINLLDMGRVCALGQRDRSDWRRIAVTDYCQHLSVIVNRPRGVHSDFSMIRLHNSDIERGIAQARPPVEHPRRRLITDQVVMRHSYMFNMSQLYHPFKLTSVYPRIKFDDNQEATTFQDGWVTVDYMYFSCCNKLRLLERLRLPTRVECEALGPLPNAEYGSDHLMLAAHFEIRDNAGAH